MIILFAMPAVSLSAATVSPADFEPWAPPVAVQPLFSRTETGLSIRLESRESIGFYRASLPVAAKACRVRVEAAGTVEDDVACGGILTWRQNDSADSMLRREYLEPGPLQNGVRLYGGDFTVPERATRLEVRLFFKWTPGEVEFRNLTMTPIEPPSPRPVRLVSTRLQPMKSAATMAGNLEKTENLLKRIAAEVEKPDLVLFTECFTDRRVPGSLAERSEPIPGGPTFELLSRYARQLNCYLVGNIHEIEDGRHHNTAFIVGRQGELVGKYRKVHLTMREMEQGLLPGREYPVFELDFGKVGIAICWDSWFSESFRLLRQNGAELVLLPIAGDGMAFHRDSVWVARAHDNGIYLATSPTNDDTPVRIIAPSGEILAEKPGPGDGYAVADLDLARRDRYLWLSVGRAEGEARSIYFRERRPTTYKKLGGEQSPE